MSSALLKKSLEMFREDLADLKGVTKKKKKSSDDPMERISTNKKGVRKGLKRLNQQEKSAKELKLKRKHIRTAEEDVADMEEMDFTEQNIMQIQKLSALSKTGKFITSQVLDSHQGKLSRNRPQEETKKEEYKSILFDD